VFPIDSTSQQGPELSSLALVRRLEDGNGPAAASDPLEYQGKRVLPSLFTELEPGVKPSVFFRVYPDRANPAQPRLRAQVLREGRLVADQTAELPEADASGGIPVLIEAAAHPGSHEMRLSVSQGSSSSTEEIRYQIAAP